MTIKTYPVEKYRDCEVYLRNFSNHFEYLTVIRNQIYTGHMTVRASLSGRLAKFLRLRASEYTDNEMKAILKQLKISAATTVDFILDKDKQK